MDKYRTFLRTFKKLFIDHSGSASKPYENTYVKFIKLEEEIEVNIFNGKLTLEVKKYSFTPPGKNSIFFYRVVAAFQTNSYHNSHFRISLDNENDAKEFYLKASLFILKSVKNN